MGLLNVVLAVGARTTGCVEGPQGNTDSFPGIFPGRGPRIFCDL